MRLGLSDHAEDSVILKSPLLELLWGDNIFSCATKIVIPSGQVAAWLCKSFNPELIMGNYTGEGRMVQLQVEG